MGNDIDWEERIEPVKTQVQIESRFGSRSVVKRKGKYGNLRFGVVAWKQAGHASKFNTHRDRSIAAGRSCLDQVH